MQIKPKYEVHGTYTYAYKPFAADGFKVMRCLERRAFCFLSEQLRAVNRCVHAYIRCRA